MTTDPKALADEIERALIHWYNPDRMEWDFSLDEWATIIAALKLYEMSEARIAELEKENEDNKSYISSLQAYIGKQNAQIDNLEAENARLLKAMTEAE